ncbi:hypothetical protein [Longispora albida]|uniref:hypothetical protein n=1 Tax=Longispora albida TaxID=203523 RepID=UPI000365B0BE|nr:hypothetical protein [Longispora albida]
MLESHLLLLGLTAAEATGYLRLLRAGGAMEDPDGVPGELVDLGLVTVDGSRVTAVPPDVGLAILTGRREAAIAAAQEAVTAAYADYRRSRDAEPGAGLVETVTGAAIRQRIRQAEDSVTAEIRRFDTPPYHFPDVENDVELAHLASGIRYRVVYAASALDRPGYLDRNIGPCVAAGEAARQAASLPVKMTLVDDRIGLLSLARPDCEPVLLVVRPSGILSALAGLFELTWRPAAPLYPAAAPAAPAGLLPADRRLLELLAAGTTDDLIIRELGLSRRTFYRRLQALMARSGAVNRMQLALATHEAVSGR